MAIFALMTGFALVNVDRSDVIIVNCNPEDARWADLLRGDEVGNADTVDLGKLQMFFFTFVLVLSYSAAILATLEGTDPFTALPTIDESMNTLLGISNTGYLANKTVNHSQPPKKKSVERRPAVTQRWPGVPGE